MFPRSLTLIDKTPQPRE